MNKKVKEKWLEALRSGEYEQGSGYLRTTNDSFCALGVLCDVAVKDGVEVTVEKVGILYKYDSRVGFPPRSVTLWAGFDEDYGIESIISGKNDSGESFEKIADFIEKDL